ncbi:MAG TPA: APC family permease [Polyangiaceae bacterium]|nr:APC family permease [Polyangiaceae bacterium]
MTTDSHSTPPPSSELVWDEQPGQAPPGQDVVRIARHAPLTPIGLRGQAPTPAFGRAWGAVKRLTLGPPLATAQADRELLSKSKALAVLSSDALSSVAYATEESLRVLMLAGAGAVAVNVPIAVAILVLLAVVTLSYRQTIFAYPSGGGSYVVASQNLGRIAGLVAAAALFIDYVLSAAVSVSSGVAALTSAVPPLAPHAVALGLVALGLLTLVNLRGVRESATIFGAPTYLFVFTILGVIAVGAFRAWILHERSYTGESGDFARETSPLTVLLVLKAFSSGCTAMTGIEAISNDVPAFRPPQARNAAKTLTWMSALLGTMFLGITLLAKHHRILPRDDETVLSQLARATVGGGVFYYGVQLSTLLVLVLAANTSYADFPRLACVLARDGFMPKQFAFRGDRLAYSVGIVALSVVSMLLVVAFRGDVSALIPLYAVAVFVAFALSQAGMVRHWASRRGSGWIASALINAAGATVSSAVAIVAGATKLAGGEPLFTAFGLHVHAGSWVVLVLMPLIVWMFLSIERHYRQATFELANETPLDPEGLRHKVVVPVSAMSRVALQTLAYARSLTDDVSAVHVADDRAALEQLRTAWLEQAKVHPFLATVELVLIESPYRSLVGPILAYVDEVKARDNSATLSVIVPELVPSRWSEVLLHNQSAFRLKAALLFRPGTIVTSVPFHLRRHLPRR